MPARSVGAAANEQSGKRTRAPDTWIRARGAWEERRAHRVSLLQKRRSVVARRRAHLRTAVAVADDGREERPNPYRASKSYAAGASGAQKLERS